MSVDQRIREGLHTTSAQLPEPDTHGALSIVTTRGRAAIRRRGLIAGGLAAAAAVVVAVSLGSGDGAREAPPLDNPSPTQTDATSEQWTPERIRAEGSPWDEVEKVPYLFDGLPASESGLAARMYVACDSSPCGVGPYSDRSDWRVALEVTQDGRSAVFDVGLYAWIKQFDEDSVLVQDADAPRGDPRFQLLQADGTAVPLRMVDDPAPAVPGPNVFIIDDFAAWSDGFNSDNILYLVDDRAGTLRPLDVPEAVGYWGPNVEEFLWGVTADCRVFWAAAGTLEDRRLDCQDDMEFSFMADEWFPAGWLRPGRMVLAEQREPTSDTPLVLHVSLDAGSTWQQIPVHNSDDDNIRHALQQIG